MVYLISSVKPRRSYSIIAYEVLSPGKLKAVGTVAFVILNTRKTRNLSKYFWRIEWRPKYHPRVTAKRLKIGMIQCSHLDSALGQVFEHLGQC